MLIYIDNGKYINKYGIYIPGFIPYTQLNTIDLCTFTFITNGVARIQGASEF